MRKIHGRSQMMSRQKVTNDEKNALQLRAHLAIAPFLPEVVDAQIDSNHYCGNCGCPLTRGEVGFRFALPSGDDPDNCDIRYYSVFCSRECISVAGRPLVTVPPWEIEGQDEV